MFPYGFLWMSQFIKCINEKKYNNFSSTQFVTNYSISSLKCLFLSRFFSVSFFSFLFFLNIQHIKTKKSEEENQKIKWELLNLYEYEFWLSLFLTSFKRTLLKTFSHENFIRIRSRILFVRSVRSRFLLKINKSSDKATVVLEVRAHTKLA